MKLACVGDCVQHFVNASTKQVCLRRCMARTCWISYSCCRLSLTLLWRLWLTLSYGCSCPWLPMPLMLFRRRTRLRRFQNKRPTDHLSGASVKVLLTTKYFTSPSYQHCKRTLACKFVGPFESCDSALCHCNETGSIHQDQGPFHFHISTLRYPPPFVAEGCE
jgi:hypothetical protein